MEALAGRYKDVMVRTRMLSVLAAAWMLVFAGWELIAIVNGIAVSENVDANIAVKAIAFHAIVASAFIARLIVLARIETIRYSSVALSWLMCVTIAWLYFTDTFPCCAVYSMIEPDSLATWSWVYVLLSFARFVVTAAFAAGTRSHESNSYS